LLAYVHTATPRGTRPSSTTTGRRRLNGASRRALPLPRHHHWIMTAPAISDRGKPAPLLEGRATHAVLSTIIKRWHQMAHVLWQQRCLEVASRLHHLRVVDETRRTYRHHGRHRDDAPRRIAAFRHATLRVATQFATQRLNRWGSPAARARLARTAPSIACGSETPTAASRRLKPRRSDNEGAS